MSDKNISAASQVINMLYVHKGADIKVLKLQENYNSLTDYLVVCTANSTVHAKGIAQNIIIFLKKNKYNYHVEGTKHHQWVLLHVGELGLLINIMLEEERILYQLEDLWKDRSTMIATVQKDYE